MSQCTYREEGNALVGLLDGRGVRTKRELDRLLKEAALEPELLEEEGAMGEVV